MAEDTENNSNTTEIAKDLLKAATEAKKKPPAITIPRRFYDALTAMTKGLESFGDKMEKQSTAIDALIQKFTENQDAPDSPAAPRPGIGAKDDSTGQEAAKALEAEKVQKVELTDISKTAEDKITKLLQGLGINPSSAKKATEEETPDKDNKSFMGTLGALMGGAIALAIGSWFSDGPFKGLMKVVSQVAIAKIIPIATKLFPTLAKFLGPIAKKLPVIGFIINLGTAISRVMQGDIIGGLIDMAAGIATFVPGIGTAVSIGLGFLNAARDLSGSTEDSKKKDTTADVGLSFLFKTVAPFVAKIASKLKFIPILGNIFQLGLGVQHIMQGGIKGWSQGILEIVGGLAGFVPGVGTIVSWAATGISLLIDLMSSPEEKPKEGELKSEKGLFAKIGDTIKSMVKKSLRFLPGIGTLIQLGDAMDAFREGRMAVGLKSLLKAGLTLIPGMGGVVAWLIEDEGDQTPPGWFLDSPKDEKKFDVKAIYKAITEGVQNKLRTILKNLKKLPFMPDAVIDKISSMFGLDEESEADTKTEIGSGGAQSTGSTPQADGSSQSSMARQHGEKKKKLDAQAAKIEQIGIKAGILRPGEDFSSQRTPEGLFINGKKVPEKFDPDAEGVRQLTKGYDPNDTTELSDDLEGFPDESTTQEQAKAKKQDTSALQPDTSSRIPLDIPKATAMSDSRIVEKLDDLLAALKGQQPALASASNNMAVVDGSSGGSSTTNIFNNGSERDIPYMERNKYRQQMGYTRGLL